MQTNVLFTYDDYRTLPETGPRFQLIDGDLSKTPAPNTKHQRISRNLGFLLIQFAKSTTAGEVFVAPFDVVLSDTDVVQPDIVYVRTENRNRITKAGLKGAPDLVAEILSPSTEELDRGIKLKRYAKFGVEELWLIDPRSENLEIYRLQKDHTRSARTVGIDDTLTSRVLPGFECDLREVFPADELDE